MFHAQIFIIAKVALYHFLCVHMCVFVNLFLNSVIYVGNSVIYVFFLYVKYQFFAHWYLSPCSGFYLRATFLVSSRYYL